MKEKCVIFEGQGAQYKGMGKEAFESFADAREVFDTGSAVTGIDLKRLCFETETERLSKTNNAQMAMFTVSMAIYNVLAKRGFVPTAFAGFSLGECSALCAAGVFSLQDGFLIVQRRGDLMEGCASKRKGAMYAIIGLEDNIVEDICRKTDGFVVPANYNCPLQIVIAGDENSAKAAADMCVEKGAKRAVRLAVGGAFHTKHMAGAALELREFLKGFKFKTPTKAVYSNILGDGLKDFSNLPDYLAGHILSPVRWKREVNSIYNQIKPFFYEIGCKGTLSQFNRRINKEMQTKKIIQASDISEVVA